MRSEIDILNDRIEKDLVAFGEFCSNDLMSHSVNPDDFLLLDDAPAGKDIKKTPLSISEKSALDLQDEEDGRSGLKLHLYSKDKSQ